LTAEDHRIDLAELQTALDIRDPDYASKIFRMIDRDGSGTVSCQEFLAAIESLTATDLVTGLQACTHMGRPGLGKTLKTLCTRHDFRFRKENF
jgi:hypothetical protein